ncbi:MULTISPECIES: glycerol-3-phosphate 1-O-acyltransferase PlsY [Thioclava]|uniref:Glycerol-3-phosphate acyltransferase n=1 Tax=Thioclava nitratireducens TaxID=1915078 RepID=A0ABN4XCP4_9RHOB|nr:MULTISPECIES: glycerol-3-phosphate 1-O-acyltransferase PlsY [Thioclava]AQS47048.1 acyl-phosphate glycerol 3-phosphate acyltransferase [Thioclava nitratireducens]OWY01001.1 acyl-phosphate glycerol 3-phosphate acyltransferase [Thioclava sp. IC9]OWY01093.1 acyl-phosphate glycerol 3-phosphate acyltransferase [Thioclava sp. F1Mire-8]OWY08686.1 acyl-phosphate glycerol 3-phosphate acyltransferase [Thioclava sp. F42-5]OWY11847.1 acyl-phosphate glycerol 3-phosphate acyltransferase [Thioclava sp. F34
MPGIENGSAWLGLVAALGYLLGSVPFGLVITKLFKLGDLRKIGSGNIGATNVLRTGSKSAALATLLLDSGKGAIAVLIARYVLGETAAQVAGAAAFIGHIYPVWLRFQGGKGVATFLGTMIALAWPVGLATCAVWLVTAVVTRISSLAALVSAAATVPLAYFLGYRELMMLAAGLSVLIFWRHRTNIARLAMGTEPKIGKKT